MGGATVAGPGLGLGLGLRLALRCVLAALLAATLAIATPAQPPSGQAPSGQAPSGQAPSGQQPTDPSLNEALEVLRQMQAFEGLPVGGIEVLRSVGQELVPVDEATAAGILRAMGVQVGDLLSLDAVSQGVRNLWRQRSMAVQVFGAVVNGRLVLRLLVVRQWRTFDDITFVGNKAFDDREIRAEILGLLPGAPVNELQAKGLRKVLINRYQAEGFLFCSVVDEPFNVEENGAELLKIRFRIDEGPKVRIRDVFLRGNRAFDRTHAFATLIVDELVLPDASVESRPRLFSLETFSMEKVQNDLTRMELFYRKRGYRDARAFLEDLVFSEDRSMVDVYFLIDEGPRYTVAAVRVEHVDTGGNPIPEDEALYPVEELQTVLEVKAGDYFDANQIEKDVRRLEDWYGKRGHPTQEWFPGPVGNVLDVRGPAEVILPDNQLELIYEIVEGRAKRVRDVLVAGNANTLDRVVRRDIRQKPGEQVNTEELDRTIAQLRQRLYFRDPQTLRTAEVELRSVQGEPDVVDVRVEVPDPPTTEFTWGVALGTGSGVAARVQLTKRNADLSRTPSGWGAGTLLEEFLNNRAFHGAGQEVSVFLAPGTLRSRFQVSFFEPDIFKQHEDPYGLRVRGARLVDFEETYSTDILLAELGLVRQFGFQSQGQILFRQSTSEVENINPLAPGLVFANEGNNEIREIEASFLYRDENRFIFPTEGYNVRARAGIAGGLFGADEDFYQAGIEARALIPVYENDQGLEHVVQVQTSFDWGKAYGDSDDLFLARRYFMGGRNLRGFDVRSAGPTEFGNPVGGEARLLGSLEYQIPFIQRRGAGRVEVQEAVRLVGFVDYGQLGLRLDDRTFDEVRVSAGFGVRIFIQELGIPIRIELGWPLLYEETDDRRQLFFSLSR